MRLIAKTQKSVVLIKKNGSRVNITMNIDKVSGGYLGLTQCSDNIDVGDYIEQIIDGNNYLYEIVDVNVGTGDIKKVDLNKKIRKENQKMVKKDKILKLITLGETALKEECRKSSSDIVMPSYISGDIYLKWLNETQLFVAREMSNHPFAEKMIEICEKKNNSISSARKLLSYLKAMLDEEDSFTENEQQISQGSKNGVVNRKVFIVHGHDDAAINIVARTLEHDGFIPIILREQPDNGNTIIEKIEEYSDVGYAVVLYTPCDEGRDGAEPDEPLRKRARQNVVFEHGFLIGHLGRGGVSALVKGDIEIPGDISGVVYIPMDEGGAWKLQLSKNMRAAGLPVDANNWI